MAGQWFYRMFGDEFGPMPLEKLKELAEAGTIQALDYVRRGPSQEWVAAATVDELELSASERRPVPKATARSTDVEISTTAVSNDWYCQLDGQDLGPLSFEELHEYVRNEQLGADDQVKLGVQGKWRRVGSIGRLMAALPYQAVEKTIVQRRSKPVVSVLSTPEFATPQNVTPAVDTEGAYRAAYEDARNRITESILTEADAVFKAAEEQAQSLLAWTTAPNVDRCWWGWAGGFEFGPVEFAQILGLAMSGQLKPADFVRNGQYGQFVPAANVPGLLNAVEIIARATEARNLARTQAQATAALAAAAAAPPVALAGMLKSPEVPATPERPVQRRSNPAIAVSPAPKSNPSITIPQVSIASGPQVTTTQDALDRARTMRPKPSSGPEVPLIREPQADPVRGTFGSSSSAASAYANRPAPVPYKAPVRSRTASSGSTWLSDLFGKLQDPKMLGYLGGIAVVTLFFGWGFLPKSRAADIKRYQTLKSLVDEIRAKRTSSPADLPPLQQKLEKTAKEIAAEVKDQASRDEPAKQCLLWATRDEIPRFLQAGLAAESPAELVLVSRLQDTAYELGLEKRPVVAPAPSTAESSE